MATILVTFFVVFSPNTIHMQFLQSEFVFIILQFSREFSWFLGFCSLSHFEYTLWSVVICLHLILCESHSINFGSIQVFQDSGLKLLQNFLWNLVLVQDSSTCIMDSTHMVIILLMILLLLFKNRGANYLPNFKKLLLHNVLVKNTQSSESG